MATQASIARHLGYTDGGWYTRGDINMLTEEIEYLETKYRWLDPIELTKLFLNDPGGGIKFFGRTGLSMIEKWPEWDHDRETIMLQVYYLFRLCLHRLEGNVILEINHTPAETTRVKRELRCQQAPKITRHLIPRVLAPSDGGFQQTPIASRSLKEMIRRLQSWVDRHPTERLPGSTSFRRSTLRDSFAKETVFLTQPDSIAWIFSVQIPDERAAVMGDLLSVSILRLADGTSMLVRSLEVKLRWTTYSAWMSERNFSESAIAVSAGPALSVSAFQEKLNVPLSSIFGDDSGIIELLIEIGKGDKDFLAASDMERDNRTRPLGHKTKASSPISVVSSSSIANRTGVQVGHSDSGVRSTARNRRPTDSPNKQFGGHDHSRNLNHHERDRPSPCAVETPPVQAADENYNRLKEQQNVWNKGKSPLLQRSGGTWEAGGAQATHGVKQQASALSNVVDISDDEIVDQAPATVRPLQPGLQSKRQRSSPSSGRAFKRRLIPVNSGSGGEGQEQASPETAAIIRLKTTKSGDSSSSSVVPVEKRPPRETLDFLRLRFFSAVDPFGAVSKAFEECSNFGAFFGFAHRFARLQREEPLPFAVQVTFPGKAYPTLVEWQNRQGFEDMMDEISLPLSGKRERVDVEVRIVRE